MRLVTMAPPIPPTSFVSQWPLGGVVDLAFCNLIDFWGRAVDRPSSNGKCSPEGCTFSGRGLAKRPPQGLKSSPEGAKITSWRPRGALGGAVGRQMAGQTAPEALLGGAWAGRKRSWAALGAVLAALAALFAALWVVLTPPVGPREGSGGSGRPREAPGKDSGSPCWSFFWWSCRRSREKFENLHVLLMLDAFWDRVLALVSGSFLLAWPAPGEEADIDKS